MGRAYSFAFTRASRARVNLPTLPLLPEALTKSGLPTVCAFDGSCPVAVFSTARFLTTLFTLLDAEDASRFEGRSGSGCRCAMPRARSSHP